MVPTLRIEAETAELEPIVGLALHRMIGRAEIGLSYNVVEPRDRYLHRRVASGCGGNPGRASLEWEQDCAGIRPPFWAKPDPNDIGG